MSELPNAYNKYESDTQDALHDVLQSIEHLTHILNGVRADILNGCYHEAQAERDLENITYTNGVDVFAALECLAECGWREKESEEV